MDSLLNDLAYPFILVLLLVSCWLVVPTYIALRKGYSGWSWFFAGGIIGAFVLLLVPTLHSPTHDTISAKRINMVGKIFSLAQLLLLYCWGTCMKHFAN